MIWSCIARNFNQTKTVCTEMGKKGQYSADSILPTGFPHDICTHITFVITVCMTQINGCSLITENRSSSARNIWQLYADAVCSNMK